LSFEDVFKSLLDQIDLHHGIHSSEPPYTVLKVVAASPTEKVRTELAAYGSNEFTLTVMGFVL
jgi:hypothetical protein